MSIISESSHLTESEAWRVSGLLEVGQTQSVVADATVVSQNVIFMIWNLIVFQKHEMYSQNHAKVIEKQPNEDGYVTLTATWNKYLNAFDPKQFETDELHVVGLTPMACAELTASHRARKEWWTENAN